LSGFARIKKNEFFSPGKTAAAAAAAAAAARF